jgi:hypothetical protein
VNSSPVPSQKKWPASNSCSLLLGRRSWRYSALTAGRRGRGRPGGPARASGSRAAGHGVPGGRCRSCGRSSRTRRSDRPSIRSSHAASDSTARAETRASLPRAFAMARLCNSRGDAAGLRFRMLTGGNSWRLGRLPRSAAWNSRLGGQGPGRPVESPSMPRPSSSGDGPNGAALFEAANKPRGSVESAEYIMNGVCPYNRKVCVASPWRSRGLTGGHAGRPGAPQRT